MFDEIAERNTVIVQHGQKGTFQVGITREQVERYFARRDAYLEAGAEKYNTGATIGKGLDELIAQGFVHFTNLGRWAKLQNGTGQTYHINRRTEKNYLMVQLNLGNLAKNY